MTTPRLLLTPGEPAGIGPDITVQIAQQAWPAELIAVADPALLTDRAKQLGLPLNILKAELDKPAIPHQPGTLKIIPIPQITETKAGVLNPQNARYVLNTLDAATSICLQKQANAVVTGPVHKGVINDAGIAFTGHTEYFAAQSGVKQTLMLFVTDQMRVALATTHLPLAAVATAITQEKLRSTLTLLHDELQNLFGMTSPRILVCGLNPHAGEGGHLGREEIDTISPVISVLSEQGMTLTGPLPADTLFTPKYLRQADAVLAMYHDQALPLVKYASFGRAVNVTLGLPFIRTSVDHGTAIDIAGTGKADSGSLKAAVKLALSLTQKRLRNIGGE